MLEITSAVGLPVRLGFVRAYRLDPAVSPPGFAERLAALVARRISAPGAEEDSVRVAARDMLRFGRYKPTGRGKPASEYLLRAAAEGTFPRINSVVDVCNFVSLASLLPVSLWDVDKASTTRFTARHGRAGEAYVFNSADQVIEVEDLVVGCRLVDAADGGGEPIVNPVKDSLGTKTDERTRRVAGIVYAPLTVPRDAVAGVVAEFADLLAGCGENAESAWTIVDPGSTGTL